MLISYVKTAYTSLQFENDQQQCEMGSYLQGSHDQEEAASGRTEDPKVSPPLSAEVSSVKSAVRRLRSVHVIQNRTAYRWLPALFPFLNRSAPQFCICASLHAGYVGKTWTTARTTFRHA